MKVFVTVGTTPFDDLIEYCDHIDEHEVVLQISKDAKYIPYKKQHFDFVDSVEDYYEWADLIISHAGAGNTYKLLENKLNVIIVPNLSRVDSHQRDLANFLEVNNFACVCKELDTLTKLINSYDKKMYRVYEYKKFNKAEDILNFLLA